MTLEGRAGEEAVTFVVNLNVEVLTEIGKWTAVPLVPTSVTLLSTSFERNGDRVSSLSGSRGGNNTENDDDEIVYEDGIVGVQGDRFRLFTCVPGSYSVHMELIVPFTNQRKNAVALNGLPMATRNELVFMHPLPAQNVTVQPALTTVVDNLTGSTTIRAMFPPSSSLDIQWTQADTYAMTPMSTLSGASAGLALLSDRLAGDGSDGSESTSEPTVPAESVMMAPEVRDERPPVVTVSQAHVFTVGEGIMFVSSRFDYSILHNATSGFRIELDDSVRVLNVSGPNIRKWEVVAADELTDSDSDSDSEDDRRGGKAEVDGDEGETGGFVLVVSLKYPKDTSYTLNVQSEVDMHGLGGSLSLPNFRSRNVVREKGHIAVAAKTNVELSPTNLSGRAITKVDVREVPNTLSGLTSQPLLLAYKYLSTEYSVEINVIKHADVPVLVAIVDEVVAVVTFTEEGKMLYELQFKVRNNNRQYLRLGLAEDAEVWSTSVDGSPVKPARDGQGRLIIPIPKRDSTFMVVVSFLVMDEPVLDRGVIRIPFPKFDLPAVCFRASVFVPDTKVLKYSDAEGDLVQVDDEVGFTFSISNSGSSSSYQQNNNYGGLDQMLMAQTNMISNIDSNPLYSVGGGEMYGQPSINSTSAAGVIPMNVSIPQVGHRLCFERLLVTTDEQVMWLDIPYKAASSGWFCC